MKLRSPGTGVVPKEARFSHTSPSKLAGAVLPGKPAKAALPSVVER